MIWFVSNSTHQWLGRFSPKIVNSLLPSDAIWWLRSGTYLSVAACGPIVCANPHAVPPPCLDQEGQECSGSRHHLYGWYGAPRCHWSDDKTILIQGHFWTKWTMEAVGPGWILIGNQTLWKRTTNNDRSSKWKNNGVVWQKNGPHFLDSAIHL